MPIDAQGLEIQIGARTLLHPTNFHVTKGDKIGLVGRNGAGKTTLTRVITGDMLPTAGTVRVSGKLGYLPQDTHAADPEQTALDRMMSARDIASIIKRIRKAEKEMTSPDPDVMTKAMNRYDKAMQDFEKAGGRRNRRRPQWPPASAYPRRSWANNSARSPADNAGA